MLSRPAFTVSSALSRASAGAAHAGAITVLVRNMAAASGIALTPEVRTVGVVGLGLMGHGIAQTAAEVGYKVVAVDGSAEAVKKGMGLIDGSLKQAAKKKVEKGAAEADVQRHISETMARITASSNKADLAGCDFVIEAIIEDVKIKRNLYSELGKIVQPKAVFASNTSSFKISMMAEATGRPSQLVGMHFFNPVQIMKLVEVIRTDASSQESFDLAMRLGKAMGKEAVACKDTPGFVVNRLLVPYMAQAVLMLERGEATAADIDTAMKFGAGYPMGPFTLLDYVGLDTSLYILEGWVRDYPNEPAFVVPELLRKMVKEGKLGRKSGQGFFKWQGNKVVA